jgi:hypothetical protein
MGVKSAVEWIRTITFLLVIVCNQRCPRTYSLPIRTNACASITRTRRRLNPSSTTDNTFLARRAGARLAQRAAWRACDALSEGAVGADSACGGDGLGWETGGAVVSVEGETLDAGGASAGRRSAGGAAE